MVRLGSATATARLAEAVARRCEPGQVVALTGPLGAGKTTFVTAFARALGVTDPVTSPTFTLVHHYACTPGAAIATVLHVDLWRLEAARELADLGLDEELDDGAVAVVEWADRFDVAGDRPTVLVELALLDDDHDAREATLTALRGARAPLDDRTDEDASRVDR